MSKPSLKDILSAVHARNVFNLLGKSVIVVRDMTGDDVFVLKEISGGNDETAWLNAVMRSDGSVDFHRVLGPREVSRLDALWLGEQVENFKLVMRVDGNDALAAAIEAIDNTRKKPNLNKVVSTLRYIADTNQVYNGVYVVEERVFCLVGSTELPWREFSHGGGYVEGFRDCSVDDDIQVVMRRRGIAPDTPYHHLNTVAAIKKFIAAIAINTEEDPHQSYFDLLAKVGDRYKGAVEHLHEVLERIGSLDGEPLSINSDEYLDAVREFNDSHEAFKSLATHVAQFQFSE